MQVELSSVPYIAGALCYLILAVRLLLLPRDAQTATANKFLALLFGLFFWTEVDEFLDAGSFGFTDSEFHDNILLLSELLFGPLTYLYIANMVSRNTLLDNLKHFLPLVVMSLLAALLYSFLAKSKADEILEPVFILLYLATLLGYVAMSLNELKQYVGGSRALFSNLSQHNLNWARAWIFFMLFLALYVFVDAAYQWIFRTDTDFINIHYVICSVAALLLMWPDSANQIAITQEVVEEVPERTHDTSLEPVFDSVRSMLIEQRLFLKNGLTLSDLSDAVGFSNNDVSAAINCFGGVCFYDYINEFRVEASMELLVKYPGRSIIDIAMDSGFNSKSAFYNAFNKQVKQTPSDYRKSKAIVS